MPLESQHQPAAQDDNSSRIHRYNRQLQPDSQVQPTNTDSKATQRLSKFHNHIQLGHRATLT
jgi:hypothetical protein